MKRNNRKRSSVNSSAGLSAKASAKAGFTLVEILLVLVIIGVLASVVVVNFGGQSGKAKIKATRASIKAVATAVEMFEIERGKYPSSLQELTVGVDGEEPLIKGGMDALRDAWGNPLSLEGGGSSSVKIVSAGPDGVIGSDDDVTSF